MIQPQFSPARVGPPPWSSTRQGVYACGLCASGPISDEDALFNHVHKRHGPYLHNLQNDPTFDEQKWKHDFKARALAEGERLVKRNHHKGRHAPSSVQAEPSSANSSQAYGIEALTLRHYDSKKQTRKGEPPPGEDPGGRATVKRPKTSGSASPPQTSRPTSTRSPRGLARGGRKEKTPRHAPDLQEPDCQTRDHEPAQPPPSAPSGTAGKGSEHAVQQRRTSTQRGVVASRVMAQSNQESQRFDTPTVREKVVIEMPSDPRFPGLYMEPDSRPISQEQLALEVKSIYSGLTMVEAKCIHVDKAQAAAIRSAERGESDLPDDHWKALIALHRTLLHEHHDFFLASQHPSASPALRRLAAKYSMPARMWKHGIHSFLELLRYRLPDSLEYMISFIYFAYRMMSLLYETVPAFEDTWIECLGDLGRYRMAIEDEDFRDRETWAGVARFWYSKAADRSPGVGRLYHHLAILARPHVMQQLYLYCRSLTCVQPFQSARDSITTLFDPVMGSTDKSAVPFSRIERLYIKTHSILCLRTRFDDFNVTLTGFIELLPGHIIKAGDKWREEGAYVAISAIAALFEYGSPDSILRKLVDQWNSRQQQASQDPDSPAASPRSSPGPEANLDDLEKADTLSRMAFDSALELLFVTTKVVLRRQGVETVPVNKNVLPFVNLVLTFLNTLADIQPFAFPFSETYVDTILDGMAWEDLCVFMNTLVKGESFNSHYEDSEFPRPEKGDNGALPEDYFVNGQAWTQGYYPKGWLKPDEVVDEERSIEYASTMRMRSERVLWNGCRLAEHNKWITYSKYDKKWTAIPRHKPLIAQQRSPKLDSITATRALEDIKMDDRSDSEIDVDDSHDQLDNSEDDSPEMIKLQKADRQLTEQQQHNPKDAGYDTSRLSVPSRETGPVKAAEEIMQSGFTVMVPDENLLLNQQDVFKILIDRGWSIVIPMSVLVGLQILAASEDPRRSAADAAVQSIKLAIHEERNIRVLTEEGIDITRAAFSDRKPPEEGPGPKSDKEHVLIYVTRVASDLSAREKSGAHGHQAKPALLITESRTTRLRAKYQGVATIATSMLRSILLASMSRRRSMSGSSLGRHSPLGSEMDVQF